MPRVHTVEEIHQAVRDAMTTVVVAPDVPVKKSKPKEAPARPVKVAREEAPAPAPAITKRELPCIELGPVVARVGCNCPRKHLHSCLAGYAPNGTVGVAIGGFCQTCPAYVPDDASKPIS